MIQRRMDIDSRYVSHLLAIYSADEDLISEHVFLQKGSVMTFVVGVKDIMAFSDMSDWLSGYWGVIKEECVCDDQEKGIHMGISSCCCKFTGEHHHCSACGGLIIGRENQK